MPTNQFTPMKNLHVGRYDPFWFIVGFLLLLAPLGAIAFMAGWL